MSEMVLALYDFASKQDYIYRTSRIKEIAGASLLLAGFYAEFPKILQKGGVRLKYNLDDPFCVKSFEEQQEYDGEALYDGGGNLMVLWKSEAKYKAANKLISVHILKTAPGLSLIASCVPYTGAFDVAENGRIGDRTNLYKKNTERKNLFPAYDMPSVTPFTQIDAETFLPVTYKRAANASGSVYPAAECSLSSDRYAKAAEYVREYKKTAAEGNDEADEFFDKDGEGMFAVIYIDGNSMGNKLISCRSETYDDGVSKLREFSKQVNEYFVDAPIRRIEGDGFKFRKIIGGGDEITLICRAEDAFDVMRSYFDELQEHTITLSNQSFPCTSCAGISVFHAKSPFNVAYDVAEAACEEAKKKAHKEDGCYFCFYYCHSGVTNTFNRLHENEQQHASGKPYKTDDLAEIEKYAAMLFAAGRSNVKELGSAAQRSLADYQFEVKRVNAYLKKDAAKFEGSEKEMRLVYDMSEFYDLWFEKEGKKYEEEA